MVVPMRLAKRTWAAVFLAEPRPGSSSRTSRLRVVVSFKRDIVDGFERGCKSPGSTGASPPQCTKVTFLAEAGDFHFTEKYLARLDELGYFKSHLQCIKRRVPNRSRSTSPL